MAVFVPLMCVHLISDSQSTPCVYSGGECNCYYTHFETSLLSCSSERLDVFRTMQLLLADFYLDKTITRNPIEGDQNGNHKFNIANKHKQQR